MRLHNKNCLSSKNSEDQYYLERSAKSQGRDARTFPSLTYGRASSLFLSISEALHAEAFYCPIYRHQSTAVGTLAIGTKIFEMCSQNS